MHFTGGAAGDGEILARQVNQPSLDAGASGDHAVGRQFLSGHAELRLAVRRKQPDLEEAAAVRQFVDSLAGRQFALFVLLGDALGAAALHQVVALLLQTLDTLLHGCSRRLCHESLLDVGLVAGQSPDVTVTLWDRPPMFTL